MWYERQKCLPERTEKNWHDRSVLRVATSVTEAVNQLTLNKKRIDELINNFFFYPHTCKTHTLRKKNMNTNSGIKCNLTSFISPRSINKIELIPPRLSTSSKKKRKNPSKEKLVFLPVFDQPDSTKTLRIPRAHKIWSVHKKKQARRALLT